MKINRNLYNDLMALDGEMIIPHLQNSAFQITGIEPGVPGVAAFKGSFVGPDTNLLIPAARIFLITKQRSRVRYHRLALMHPSGNLELLSDPFWKADSSDGLWAERWRLPLKNLLREHCGRPQPMEQLHFARLKKDAQANYALDNEQVIALIHLTEELARMNQAMGTVLLQHDLSVPRSDDPTAPTISDYLGEPVDVQDFLDWMRHKRQLIDPKPEFDQPISVVPGAPFYLTGEMGYRLHGILRDWDENTNRYPDLRSAIANAKAFSLKHRMAIEIRAADGHWIETVEFSPI